MQAEPHGAAGGVRPVLPSVSELDEEAVQTSVERAAGEDGVGAGGFGGGEVVYGDMRAEGEDADGPRGIKGFPPV